MTWSDYTSVVLGGAFGGVQPPPYQAGHHYPPHWAIVANEVITITANRLYRAWFYVDTPTTFLGGYFYNSGTGDNGKKVRIGVYDSAGVREKDFGETTLNGSALLREVANSVLLPQGWHQLALVSDTAPALIGMSCAGMNTIVGVYSPPLTGRFGHFAASAKGGVDARNAGPVGEYAAFTYAALPTPITAATANLLNTDSAGAANFPLIGLYL